MGSQVTADQLRLLAQGKSTIPNVRYATPEEIEAKKNGLGTNVRMATPEEIAARQPSQAPISRTENVIKGLASGARQLGVSLFGTAPEAAGQIYAQERDATRINNAMGIASDANPAAAMYPWLDPAVQQAGEQARQEVAANPTQNPAAGSIQQAREYFQPDAPEVTQDPRTTQANAPYYRWGGPGGNVPIPQFGAAQQARLGYEAGSFGPQMLPAAVATLATGGTGLVPAVIAGLSGGALEGLSEYEQAIDKGYSPQEATRQMAVMGVGATALNALPWTRAIRLLPKQLQGRAVQALGTGLLEGGTEMAEGGVSAAAKIQTPPQTAQEWEDAVGQIAKGVWDERGVFLAAMITGTGTAAFDKPDSDARKFAQQEAGQLLLEFNNRKQLGYRGRINADGSPIFEPEFQRTPSDPAPEYPVGPGVSVADSPVAQYRNMDELSKNLPPQRQPDPLPQSRLAIDPQTGQPVAAPIDPGVGVVPESPGDTQGMPTPTGEMPIAPSQRPTTPTVRRPMSIAPIAGANDPTVQPFVGQRPIETPEDRMSMPTVPQGNMLAEPVTARRVSELPEVQRIKSRLEEFMPPAEAERIVDDLAMQLGIQQPSEPTAPEAPKTAKEKLAALRDARKQSLIDTTVAQEAPTQPTSPLQSDVEPQTPVGATESVPETPKAVEAPAQEAEFHGWQPNVKGKPPIALYNIPTPEGGKTTVTAETAAAQGYSVPEPPVEAVEAPKDPESQFQEDIRAISAESKEKRLKDLRREFMQNKGLSHTQENGIQQILHMSSKKSGSFQLSSIGADGIPNMDQEFDNISEAIAEFDRTVGKRRADLPDIALMLKPGEANFIYEPRLRPVDIGTIPKEGFVGRREGGKWGRAAFNRPLTEKELDQYELTPVGYEDNTGGSGLIEGAMNEQTQPTQPLTATANRAAMPEQREGTNYEKTLGAIGDTLAGNRGVVAGRVSDKKTQELLLAKSADEFRATVNRIGGVKIVSVFEEPSMKGDVRTTFTVETTEGDTTFWQQYAQYSKDVFTLVDSKRIENKGVVADVAPTAKEKLAAKVEVVKGGAPEAPKRSVKELKLAKDRVDKHGLTKDQMEYLTGEIQARWSELPNKKSDYEGVPNVATIKVPGDGTFIIGTQEAANAIHKRLTGKWIDESMAYDSKRSGGSSSVDARTTPDYMKGGEGGYTASAKTLKERQQAEDEALRLLNEAKTPNEVAYARIQYDRAMGKKDKAETNDTSPMVETTSISEETAKGNKFYWYGNEAQYTGKTTESNGDVLYEFEYLEGTNAGKKGVRMAPDDPNASRDESNKPTGRPTPQVPAPTTQEKVQALRDKAGEKAAQEPIKQPYEMTSEEYFQSELAKNKYKDKYEQDPKALKLFHDQKDQEWMDMLHAQAEVDALPLNVIDDYAAKFGESFLFRNFRGKAAKGIEGWAPSDVRRVGPNDDTFFGFMDDMNKLRAGAAKKALNAEKALPGGKSTVRRWIDKLYNSKELSISTDTKNKMSKSDREHLEAMRARPGGLAPLGNIPNKYLAMEAKEKTVYYVNGVDLGKTAYDYAQFRLASEADTASQRITPEPAQEQPAPAPKRTKAKAPSKSVDERLAELQATYDSGAMSMPTFMKKRDALWRERQTPASPVETTSATESTKEQATVPRKITVNKLLSLVPEDVVTYDSKKNTISFDASEEGITKVREAMDKALDATPQTPTSQAKYEEAYGDIMDAVFAKQEEAPKEDRRGAINLDIFFSPVKAIAKAATLPRWRHSRGFTGAGAGAKRLVIGLEGIHSRATEQINNINRDFRRAAVKANGIKTAFAQIPEQQRLDLGAYLKEPDKTKKQKALDKLPEPMREVAIEMRAYIDSIGRKARQLGIVTGELGDIIESKDGFYTRATYKLFTEPSKWNKGTIPKAIQNRAKEYVQKRFEKEWSGYSKEDRGRLAEQAVTQYMSLADYPSNTTGIPGGTILGTADLSNLYKKGDIAKPIADLWGLENDGVKIFTETASRASNMFTNMEFVKSLMGLGRGKFIWTKEDITNKNFGAPGDFERSVEITRPTRGKKGKEEVPLGELLDDGSKSIVAAFGDAKILPEIKDALEMAVEPRGEVHQAIKELAFFNSIWKQLMTKWNPGGQARNLIGSHELALMSGDALYGTVKDRLLRDGLALRIAQAGLPGIKDQKARDMRVDMIERGVLLEGGSRELRELQRESEGSYAKAFVEKFFETIVPEQAMGAFNSADEMAQAAYIAGDDLIRAFAYLTQIEVGKDIFGLNEEQAKQRAADEVRDRYPTYSENHRYIQALRFNPFFAPLTGFVAAMPRAIWNNLAAIKESALQPGMKAKKYAAQQTVGMVLAMRGPAGMTALTAMLLGIGDDEEEDMNRFNAPWDKVGSPAWRNLDRKTGDFEFINQAYTDPTSVIKEPARAFMNAPTVKDGAIAAIKEITQPYLAQEVMFEAIIDLSRNRKESGGTIYNDADNAGEMIGKMIAHVAKNYIPPVIKSAMKAMDSDNPITDMASSLSGMNPVRVNIPDQMERHATTNHRLMSAGSKDVMDALNSGDKEAFRKQLQDHEATRRKAFESMVEDYEAALRIMEGPGVKKLLIEKMKAGGLSDESAMRVIRNKYKSWEPSDEKEKIAFQKMKRNL